MKIKPESRVMVAFWAAYIITIGGTLAWYLGFFK
jgi:hypothetical protein